MTAKNYFKFLAVSAILLGTSATAQGQTREDMPIPRAHNGLTVPAKAPSVVHDYDWYAAKTYTWTDANGASHTSSLVDPATNPYQIYDMLRWVYCNPEIPGIKYTAVTNGDVYYGEQYDLESSIWSGTYHQDPGWNISNSDVTTPYEEGHTLFLVKLKNYNSAPNAHTTSKAQIINIFNTCIESVTLITDAMRVGDGDNIGSIVNIEGEFNRFFVLGKGKSYYVTPTTSDNEPPYAPFYNMFEEYSPTTKDSGSEIKDFYDKMTAGAIYPVIHDCSSVMRMEHYFSMAGKNGTQEKSLTGMFLYIPDNRYQLYPENRNYDPDHQPQVGIYVIELGAQAADNGDHTYTVQLDWTSKLNEAVGSEVPQNYTVYVYVTDETGTTRVELVKTTETTYSYVVPQDEHSYTITYVVYGEAIENNAFNTWSNDASVVIPGWNDFISLTLKHYESDFVNAEGKNYYRNFMGIINDVNAITPENIDNGMNTIIVNRFDADLPDVQMPIATITFTNNNGNVRYSIEYVEQNILPGYNLNQINVATSGNLGNYAAGAVVDLSSIQIVDQFAESVEGNEHPDMYGYVLTLGEKTSNDVEVPVTKVDATIDGYYTKAQVDNDTDLDNLLPVNVKSANFELYLENNARLYYYTLDRGIDAAPSQQISYLQRRTDGTFIEMNDALGNAGNVYDEGILNYYDDPAYTGDPGQYISYLPIAWTFGTNRVKQDGENSYGSPVIRTGVGSVDFTNRGTKTVNEAYYWLDEDGNMCTLFNPILDIVGSVPEDASVEYIPYMYRVWRLSNDVRNFKKEWNLGDGTFYFVNDEETPREPAKLIAEEYTNQPQITIGNSNDELAFGALYSPSIEFLVRFYYVKADRATNENKYYVVQLRQPWTNIATAVSEISTAGQEVSKTYVNAQGVKSDKPFDGVNIVITRYSDGTTQTTKVVR